MKKVNGRYILIPPMFICILLVVGACVGVNKKAQELPKARIGTSDGVFLLTSSKNQLPLENYTVQLIDKGTGAHIASGQTDETGKTNVGRLIVGKEYKLKVSSESGKIETITEQEWEFYKHHSFKSPTKIGVLVEKKANHIEVPTILQNPELPNGCEITSLTAILNFEGIDVSKTTMADDYLAKGPFEYQEGKRYGPDPNVAYGGNPRDKNGGWYVFSEPIVKTANLVIGISNKNLLAKNISGSSKEEILNYIEAGVPVLMWTTLDLSPPIQKGGWYINGTNEFHESYTNLHAVVLMGWKDGKVRVMNPLKGDTVYGEREFFNSYEAMGSQAVIIQELS